MLKRVISAIIALLIFVPLIIKGGIMFAVGMGVLSILAYKEILDLRKSHKEYPVIPTILGLLCILILVIGNYYEVSNLYLIDRYSLLLPFGLLLIPTIFYKKDNYTTKDAFYLIGCVLLIGLFFNSLITIRNLPGDNTGLFIFIYLFSVTILTDTFAYMIGCLIGKHKMAPTVSPKKSWEGFFAGLIGGSICSIAIYNVLFSSGFDIKVILMTICLCVIGQCGDLVFSKIKRENNIKDFSNIMPGHGGVLDRLDSIVFVVIFYVIISSVF